MDSQKSPLATVAVSLFLKEFSGWLSVRAEISDYERQVIEATMDLLWLDSSPTKDLREVYRTATGLYHCMDQASATGKQEAVARQYVKSADLFSPALNDALHDRSAAKAEADTDRRVKMFLALYKHLYEKLGRTVLAPAILAFGVVKKQGDRKFDIEEDGRAKMSALKEIEKLSHYPQDRFRIGINQRVRNAYSHQRYELMDGARVKLWDIDPRRGKVTWGPEVWPLEKLESLCDALWFNCLGAMLGNVLYSINNRKVIRERGWGPKTNVRHSLRLDDIRNTISRIADEWSFDVPSVERDGDTLQITFQTRFKGIDQNEEILLGGGRWSKRFILPVRYEEHEICRQLVGLFQSAEHIFNDIKSLDISVRDARDVPLGQLGFTLDYLRGLKGPSKQTFEDARKGFTTDTLGAKTMHVRFQGPPLEV